MRAHRSILRRWFKATAMLAALAALTACGGGSGGTDPLFSKDCAAATAVPQAPGQACQ